MEMKLQPEVKKQESEALHGVCNPLRHEVKEALITLKIGLLDEQTLQGIREDFSAIFKTNPSWF